MEWPVHGLAEAPDHLRDWLIHAPYAAARRLVDAALDRSVDFVVLSGDVLDARRTGPRGPAFLIEQFERLGARGIGVYWALGRADSAEHWPGELALPKYVARFPAGSVRSFEARRDGETIAWVVGASRRRNHPVRAADFVAPHDALPRIAVAYGKIRAAALANRGIVYWALGGFHAARALPVASGAAVYPGTHQGRNPSQPGPHGARLVEIDSDRAVRVTALASDVVRFCAARVEIESSTTAPQLESLLDQRARGLVQEHPGVGLVIDWTVAGDGPLLVELRRGRLAADLLAGLRDRFGVGPAPAWSATLDVEPPDVFASGWMAEDSLRGDYVRALARFRSGAGESFDPRRCLPASPLGRWIERMTAAISDDRRQRFFREAALLGGELLGGEGNPR